jgi:hypothetical protein
MLLTTPPQSQPRITADNVRIQGTMAIVRVQLHYHDEPTGQDVRATGDVTVTLMTGVPERAYTPSGTEPAHWIGARLLLALRTMRSADERRRCLTDIRTKACATALTLTPD